MFDRYYAEFSIVVCFPRVPQSHIAFDPRQVNWSCLQALVGCADGRILLWDLGPFQVLQSCVAGMPATCMLLGHDSLVNR